MVIWGRLTLAPPVSRTDGGVAAALVMVGYVTFEETLGATTALALVTGGVTPKGTFSAEEALVTEGVTPEGTFSMLLVLTGGVLTLLEGTPTPRIISAPVFSGFVADLDCFRGCNLELGVPPGHVREL